jgi:gliding motility associated protien GldN
MKKTIVLLLIGSGLLFAGNPEASSQDLTLGSIYQKDNVPYRRPVPLPHLREADVVWSRMIWRMVDLRDKMNHPLYFPTEPFGSRMSLIDVLYRAVENGEILAYSSEEFRDTLDMKTINERLGALTTTQTVVDVATGQEVDRAIEGTIRTFEVREYLLLEQWYFDKQHSTFRSRVIGFAPIRVYQRRDDDGNDTGEWQKRQIFWVYYPHIREILARSEAFTTNNDLSNLSFDDIFMQRRFSGYIFRESNVYNNRAIMDYAMGRDALYEAERIQNAIFDFEQDLWEY